QISKDLSDGFTEEEVDPARKELVQERQIARAEDGKVVRQLQRNAEHGWTMARAAELERKIGALTVADVNAAVKRHINPSSISYFKGGDFKKAAAPAQ